MITNKSDLGTVRITVECHNKDDKVFLRVMACTEDELRAMTRYLSSIRISDLEDANVVPLKDLHDICVCVCKGIKEW